MTMEHRQFRSSLTQAALGANANGTVTESGSEPSRSFINARNIQTAILISLIYHVLLMALFSRRISFDLPEYWGFICVDLLMWIVALIPLIAIARKQLAWYDLIALMDIMFFGMVCTFSLVYSIDSSFTRYASSFEGFALRDATEGEFLIAVIKAESVLITFLLIVLRINSRKLEMVPLRGSTTEYKAAALVAALCLVGGAIGFVAYWSSQSFLAALTTDLGSLGLKAPEAGTARWIMLMNIALMALPLGVVGLAALLKPPRDGHVRVDGLLIAGAIFTAFINLWNGARADVLFAFLGVFAVAACFGLNIKKSTWGAMLVILVLVIGFVTVVRGNPNISQDPVGVLTDVVSGSAVRQYTSESDTSLQTLLALDRVAAVAMTLEYLRLTDEYLYGESIVAGPVNLLVALGSRFFGGGSEVPALRMANEVTFYWRYGRYDVGTAVPPSFAGEFFMQAGIPTLLILSALLGLVILWLRKQVAASTTVIGRWFLAMLVIIVAKALPAELSVLTGTIVYYLFPVVLIYGVIDRLLKLGRREAVRPASRAADV